MNLKLRRTNAQLRGTVYVATSSIHGLGVFAARKLAKGEYIGTFHGPAARRDSAGPDAAQSVRAAYERA